MSDPRDLQRIVELEGQVAEKDALLAAQGTRITELERKVEELAQLVMSLKEQLNRNSRNSHLPPSSDGPGARSSEKGKVEGQRKRGGQPGHGGHKRDLLPVDQVDRFVELYPKECENCWTPLPQVRDENATRYQVTEMPPVRPHTTEYRCKRRDMHLRAHHLCQNRGSRTNVALWAAPRTARPEQVFRTSARGEQRALRGP